MSSFVIGIDGGGSRTRVAAVAPDGSVLGSGAGGASNYDDVGIAVAQANIEAAVMAALAAGSLSLAESAGVFLGMAGVTSDTDKGHIRDIALNLRLAPPAAIGIDHDCRVALAGGLEGRPGIVQIVGTGSSTYGRTAEGDSWLAGGRGPLVSDEGSGYWLGIQAMSAAVRAADGRGPATRLLDDVFRALQIHSIDELMYRLYVMNMSRTQIATLGPLVVEAAQQGDALADAILARGGAEVAECVLAVARRLQMTAAPCEVCLVGGVAQSGPLVWRHLSGAITAALPQALVQPPALPPVLGAALLALEMIGCEPTQAVRANLRSSFTAIM